MPKIQIADKPTLDLVKSDTTAILNKTNGNSTALTNIQNGINTANSGINTANSGINNVNSTLGTVNNNVSSIKTDTAEQFAQLNQKTTNLAYSLNMQVDYDTGGVGTASHKPIVICNYRRKTFYYPDNLNVKQSSKPTSGNTTNLWLANVSPPRSDDDFLYYADVNAGYLEEPYNYTNNMLAITAMTPNIYIHYFDGGKWNAAPVIDGIIPASNHPTGVVNVFPTNNNHNLFLFWLESGETPNKYSKYYYLTAHSVNGYPKYYTAKQITIKNIAGYGNGCCVFFPSPVSKNPGSGQFAWYAMGQTGGHRFNNDYEYWNSQNMLNNKDIITIVGAYSEGADFNTIVAEWDMTSNSGSIGNHNCSEYLQAASCHLNSDPWFIFGGNDMARDKELWHIISSPTGVSRWVKKRNEIASTSGFLDTYDLFNSFGEKYSYQTISTSTGSTSSETIYTSVLSYQMHNNYGFAKNLAITSRGTVCFDESGIKTMPGDYPNFASSGNLYNEAQYYTSWPRVGTPTFRNIGMLRDKLYILPTKENDHRTMLIN